MTTTRTLFSTAMAVLFLFLTVSLTPTQVQACKASPCPPGVGPCFESVNLITGVRTVVLSQPLGVIFPIPVRVNTQTGSHPLCPATPCPVPSTVIGGTVSIMLVGPAGIFSGSAPLPIAGSGYQSQVVSVPVALPPGLIGEFLVVADASVTFSSGQVLAANGTQKMCFVEESPDIPGVPRLDMKLMTPGDFPECPAGSQIGFDYKITNNDLTHGVLLNLDASSKQNAKMPATLVGDPQLAYSISSPVFGDDYPIAWADELNGSVPLSSDPGTFVQPNISRQIYLAPGETRIVSIVSRSYPPCASGSCSQNILAATGLYSNGDDALACVSHGWGVNNTPSAPKNDDCEGAMPVPVGNPGSCTFVTASNAGAAPFSPVPIGCPGFVGGDIWFCAPVPASGQLQISGGASDFDFTGIEVFAGDCEGLFPIDCALPAIPNQVPDVLVGGLPPGQLAYFRVYDVNNDQIGTVEICASDPQPCDPSVSATNLEAFVEPAGVTLAWTAIQGSQACRVTGGPVGGPSGSITRVGEELETVFVPASRLTPGVNYSWSAQCVCDLTPPFVISIPAAPDIFTWGVLREAELVTEATLYPNPATTTVNIRFKQPREENGLLRLFSLDGKMVIEEELILPAGQVNHPLTLPALSPGTYLMKYVSASASWTEKLVITSQGISSN